MTFRGERGWAGLAPEPCFATAIEKILRRCYNRFPAGVFMSKPTQTLEET